VAIAAGAVIPLDEKRRRRHDLLAQLREVDHWRRLVAARLDLAVAAVTSIDEPDGQRLDASIAGSLPPDLREMLGLPECAEALPEASALLRLRAALRDLDEYARALRESTDLATLELAGLLDAERAGQRGGRRGRGSRPDARPAGGPRLRVVGDPAPDVPNSSSTPSSAPVPARTTSPTTPPPLAPAPPTTAHGAEHPG